MSMNGIDISGWEVDIDVRSVTADFIIVKATEGLQGTRYNRGYREMADAALETGRLLGFYHYANGEDPVAEADSFFDAIRDYKGRAVPCLDWEGKGNHLFMSGQDVWWCERFMDRIADRMGAIPLFYTSKGICRLYDWSTFASKYPLWGAEYAYEEYVYDGYNTNPWQSSQWWGAWGEYPKIHQYGYVTPRPNSGGVTGLDANIYYGTRDEWLRMCGSSARQPSSPVTNDSGLKYNAHVQDVGWCDVVRDGQTAGTVGYGKRLEAITVNPPKGWELRIKLHVQNVGWVTYDGIGHGNEVVIGTVGKGRAIECMIVEVTKRPSGDNRMLRFRVHQQNSGWKPWTLEGFASGTDGMSLRLEACQMAIW